MANSLGRSIQKSPMVGAQLGFGHVRCRNMIINKIHNSRGQSAEPNPLPTPHFLSINEGRLLLYPANAHQTTDDINLGHQWQQSCHGVILK